jgi:hypothetical protein
MGRRRVTRRAAHAFPDARAGPPDALKLLDYANIAVHKDTPVEACG